MSSKSLPAHLRQVLEEHVAQSDIQHDEELQSILDKLNKLQNSVDKIKHKIRLKKEAR